jgi:hypothetical protein
LLERSTTPAARDLMNQTSQKKQMSKESQDTSRIPLAKMLAELRTELLAAQQEGEGKDVRFLVDDIEIELQIATTQEDTGGVGIKFWVINADARLKDAEASTQKVKLKLALVDKAGKRQVPIDSGATTRPR